MPIPIVVPRVLQTVTAPLAMHWKDYCVLRESAPLKQSFTCKTIINSGSALWFHHVKAAQHRVAAWP